MASDWERVGTDPALLARVRQRYTGSGDVLDQLWWTEHPGEATPTGTADPLQEAAAARRELYRPAAQAIDTAQLAEREQRARADRAAAARAVEESAPSASTRTPPAGRRRSRSVAVVAAAVLIGVVTGGVLEHVRAEPPTTSPALAEFDRTARAADRPSAALPTLLHGATVRELRAYSSIGLVAYGVRTADGRICLLTVVLGTRASAACTSRTSFIQGGVGTVSVASADPVDDSGTRPSEEIDLRWNADGTIAITPVTVS